MPDMKIGKREARVLDKMKAGATLCCETNPHRWFLEPGGASVSPVTATKLLAKDLVRTNVAGLFGPHDAQTYIVGDRAS